MILRSTQPFVPSLRARVVTDSHSRVIIHTANMIPQDWANMCQAVWRSPLLPLDKKLEHAKQRERDSTAAFGTGTRFKRDLLAYLDAYGTKKTGSLVKQLTNFDFSDVRAALIASVPSKQVVHTIDSSKETLWGWPALKDTLRQIPRASTSATPHFVIQVRPVHDSNDKVNLTNRCAGFFHCFAGSDGQVAQRCILRLPGGTATKRTSHHRHQYSDLDPLLYHIPYTR